MTLIPHTHRGTTASLASSPRNVSRNTLCIIPARSGSKGLKDKNIRPLNGHPLLSYSIKLAKNLSFISNIIVSTDSKDYANIAENYGANVIIRSASLSLDTTPTFDVIQHVFNHISPPSFTLLLEPTSPLREACDIENAFKILNNNNKAKSIVSVSNVEGQHPSFLVDITTNNFIESYINKGFSPIRRQDISPLYFFDGSFYLSDTQTLIQQRNFYHEATLAYKLDKFKSLEIDDLDDFIMIEALLKAHPEANPFITIPSSPKHMKQN